MQHQSLAFIGYKTGLALSKGTPNMQCSREEGMKRIIFHIIPLKLYVVTHH